MAVQVESHCKPRGVVNPPKKGSCPLPSGLNREELEFAPSSVEDLNKVVPDNAPRLATPKQHPKVSKVQLCIPSALFKSV